MVAKLAAEKERSCKRADHYDKEVAAGHQHPTTHRWKNNNDMSSEFRSGNLES